MLDESVVFLAGVLYLLCFLQCIAVYSRQVMSGWKCYCQSLDFCAKWTKNMWYVTPNPLSFPSSPTGLRQWLLIDVFSTGTTVIFLL